MARNFLIRGAETNNLKKIDLDIPREKLVVFAGVSGSGKSSLVFDTIAAEASRQLADSFPAYVRNRMPRWDAPEAALIDHLSTAVVIKQRAVTASVRSTVGTVIDAAPVLRLLFSRCAEPSAGTSNAYSFNDPAGMCPECSGLGHTVRFDIGKIIDKEKSLNGGAIRFPGHQVGACLWQVYANSGLYDPDLPMKDYTQKEWEDFLHGSGLTVTIHNTTGKVWGSSYQQTYEGFQDRIERLYLRRDFNSLSKANQAIIENYTERIPCPCCGGLRLNRSALDSRLAGRNISEVGQMEIQEVIPFLDQIAAPAGRPAARKLASLLQQVEEIGLGYLNLNRPTDSLSGGELQRLKIVRHLGSALINLTYIFDEPSTGLHPKDVDRLKTLLLSLRDRGNSVLVVEHNRQLIQAADQVVELGPRAGAEGGRVVFQGSVEALRQADTATGRSLRRTAGLKKNPRRWTDCLEIRGANLHNLQNIDIRIPLHCLVAVTGVAGSGKSSLVCGVLPAVYPQAVCIGQSHIGISSRSTPATYVGAADDIRRLVGRANGLSPNQLNHNSAGGCPVCGGKGRVAVDMAFMDAVEVPCEACGGLCYNERALSAHYQGKNIQEIMSLSIDETLDFFRDQPKILKRLSPLRDVGLGYLTLSQPTSTLSGGECQRLKLANHLSEKGNLFVLDEPSAGLHEHDAKILLDLLERMVDQGNSVIFAEHSMYMARQADWIIDLGPEGGKDGGRVLFEGPPEALRQCGASYTARYIDI